MSAAKAPRRSSRTLGGGSIDHVVMAQLVLYAPPWVAWLGLPLAGYGLRQWVGHDAAAAGLASATVTLVTTGLAAFGWHVFRARANSIRVHAVASIAAMGLWLVVALNMGAHAPVPQLWVVGMTVPATWSIRRLARGLGDDAHHDGGGLMEAIGVAGRAGTPKLEAGNTRVRLPVKLDRGEATADDLQAARGRIASYAGVRRDAVRVEPVQDNHGAGDVVIVPADLLRQPRVWTGPSAPGASIVEPLVWGRYEDGERLQLWLPGDPNPKGPRNATHLGVVGMTGAGKTEAALVVCGEALTRPDVSLVWSDHVKGLQSVDPLAAGVALLLTDRPSAVQAFRRLEGVITARTAELGRHRMKQWTPDSYRTAGLKYLVYWLEESAAMVAGSEKFASFTEQARSAGISLVLSQQRFSFDRMPTSARSNIGAALCFGTKDETDAGLILSETAIDAGAAPWAWQARKPGYCYLEAPGVPSERWAIPARGDLADSAHLREVVAEWCIDPTLDAVTAAAFGSVYTDYRRQVADGAAVWQTGTTGRTVIAMPGRATVRDEDVDGPDEEDVDSEEPYPHEVPASPEPDLMPHIDVEQAIPDDGDPVLDLAVPPAPDQMEWTPSAARAALVAYLDKMAAGGHETVRPRDLVELRSTVGRSAAWLSGELARLVDEGVLEDMPDRGVYGLAPRVPAEVSA